jgi:hypothetical protein
MCGYKEHYRVEKKDSEKLRTSMGGKTSLVDMEEKIDYSYRDLSVSSD